MFFTVHAHVEINTSKKYPKNRKVKTIYRYWSKCHVLINIWYINLHNYFDFLFSFFGISLLLLLNRPNSNGSTWERMEIFCSTQINYWIRSIGGIAHPVRFAIRKGGIMQRVRQKETTLFRLWEMPRVSTIYWTGEHFYDDSHRQRECTHFFFNTNRLFMHAPLRRCSIFS